MTGAAGIGLPGSEPAALLLDIEGTLGSVAFVKDVLFPYARARLPDFLAQHADDADVDEQIEALREQLERPEADPVELAQVLIQWIDEDRKATPLKALQGLIWRAGYEDGSLRAHLYPDAVTALQEWTRQGRPLFVYSSGSIAAQRLFFRYSLAGDLRDCFGGHFDTTIGDKKDPASYRKIAAEIGYDPDQIMFLTDSGTEVEAATEAGLRVVQVVRPEDGTRPRPGALQVADLAGLSWPGSRETSGAASREASDPRP